MIKIEGRSLAFLFENLRGKQNFSRPSVAGCENLLLDGQAAHMGWAAVLFRKGSSPQCPELLRPSWFLLCAVRCSGVPGI